MKTPGPGEKKWPFILYQAFRLFSEFMQKFGAQPK